MPIHLRSNSSLDQALAKITANWAAQEVSFVASGPGRPALLSLPETLTEQLENDALALQGLSGNKAALQNALFQAGIAEWQARLTAVETVLGLWQDVQRRWLSIESIFQGSADIQTRLPDDARRFRAVHAAFLVRLFLEEFGC